MIQEKNSKLVDEQHGCQYFCEDSSQKYSKPVGDNLPPLVYPCQECFVEFPEQNQLEQHHATCHQAVEEPVQKLLILVTDADGNYHENIEFVPYSTTHNPTSPSMKILFSCQYCSKRFLGENNLINHLNLHTEENVFQCKECGRCFVSSADLKRHLQTHTGEKPFRCENCGKGFSRKFTLGQHTKSIHAGEKPYRCSVCGRCFSRRSILGKHLKTHGL